MDFTELISSFAERHGIADLAAEDNAADIGDPPAEGRADFAELLLEASLQSDAFFAKAPESGTYVAVRRLALPTLDSDAFDAALESLVNQAETWRRLLADFRPGAKAAAEAAAEEPTFGTGGFVQV